MRHAGILAAALALAPVAGWAQQIVAQPSVRSVDDTVATLTQTIEGAGAKVFAVVNHGAGAQSVGADVGGAQLVIFGNPAIGTPAIVDNLQAGLFLPLKMLVYTDAGGQVMVAYEDPAEMFAGLDGIAADAEYIQKMRGALGKFAAAASQ